jgi:hypothetical protein
MERCFWNSAASSCKDFSECSHSVPARRSDWGGGRRLSTRGWAMSPVVDWKEKLAKDSDSRLVGS